MLIIIIKIYCFCCYFVIFMLFIAFIDFIIVVVWRVQKFGVYRMPLFVGGCLQLNDKGEGTKFLRPGAPNLFFVHISPIKVVLPYRHFRLFNV